jgi:hypothetical protein
MNYSDLEKVLENSWSKFTSSDPFKWSKNNIAYGQCAVTSLVVQDYFGGEIVWANAILPDKSEISHYFNKINGTEEDFTRKQFPDGTIIPEGIPKTKEFKTTRLYILSYPSTKSRYETLKRNVEDYIRKHPDIKL